MKNFLIVLIMFTFATYAHASKIYNNNLSLGVTGSTANKDINFGQTPNGILRWNHGSSKFQFSNDGGSNFYDFQQYIDNLVSGRLVYGGLSGTLAQSPNLVWDSTNNRLGINTTPAWDLDVNGTINFVNLRGGSDNIAVDSTGFWAKNQKEVKFFEQNANGSNYMGFKAPASLTTTTNFTLPDGDGNANQALLTDGSGTLRWGDSGGGLGTNYITNANAEVNTTGWATYADAAGTSPVDGSGGSPSVTWTRVTSPILTGTASFKYTKPASNVQGEGVSYDYTITSAHNAEAQMIRMYYQTDSNYVEDCLGVWIYDKTNSVLISTTPYLIKKSGLTEHPFFEFQNSASATDYRFIIHNICTSATAFNVYFDDIQIGPKSSSLVAVDTDLTLYTPTFTGLGTVTGARGNYNRKGQMLNVWGEVTTGTPTASVTSVSLPINLSARFISTSSAQVVGEWTRGSGTSEFNRGPLLLNTANSSSVIYFGNATSISGGVGLDPLSIANGNSIVGTGQRISFKFSIPILGWSSGSQVLDIYTGRDISFGAYVTSNQTVTAGIPLTILFQNERNDSAGFYDPSTGKFTALTSGKFSFKSNVQILMGATPASSVECRFRKNGVGDSLGTSSLTDLVANKSYNFALNADITLTAGDFVTVEVSAVSQNVTVVGTGATNDVSSFYGYKIQSPNQILSSEKILAKYRRGTAQTIASNTWSIVDFPTKIIDTHNTITTGANFRFTAPRAGTYIFRASVLYDNQSWTAGNSVACTFEHNNASSTGSIIQDNSLFVPAQVTATYFLGSGILESQIDLLQGEWIDFRTLQTNAASRNLYNNQYYNWFEVESI